MASQTTDVPVVVPNLRLVVSSLLPLITAPSSIGGLLSLEAGEHGEVKIERKDDGLHLLFTKVDRLFVQDNQGVLVERVKLAPPPDSSSNKVSRTPLEEEFFTLISEDNYPNKQGETIPVPYGEDDNICLITRVPTGIIGEFINQHTKLFYEFRNRTIRPYEDRPLPAPKREGVLKREKAIVEKSLSPDMVEQLGYKGEKEMVDRKRYCCVLVCACGNTRYLKPSDVHQCKFCKPCTRKNRR